MSEEPRKLELTFLLSNAFHCIVRADCQDSGTTLMLWGDIYFTKSGKRGKEDKERN